MTEKDFRSSRCSGPKGRSPPSPPRLPKDLSCRGSWQVPILSSSSPGGHNSMDAVFEHNAVLRFGAARVAAFRKTSGSGFPIDTPLGADGARKTPTGRVAQPTLTLCRSVEVPITHGMPSARRDSRKFFIPPRMGIPLIASHFSIKLLLSLAPTVDFRGNLGTNRGFPE